jgi:hypothetical protein
MASLSGEAHDFVGGLTGALVAPGLRSLYPIDESRSAKRAQVLTHGVLSKKYVSIATKAVILSIMM